MAYSSKEIIDYLLANPSMSDADIASAMQTYNVTPSQMAQAVGLPVEEIQTRYNDAAPSVYTAENVNKLADQILSQGTTEAWTGGLPPEKAALYMADELAKSGVTDIAQVAKGDDGIINSMTGEKLISGYGERTGGNLWSGSYEGKGNTGFGVNFDESGKPVFYTQGASSSDTKDIARIIQAGLLLSGAGGALGGALGLTGAAASGVGTGLISAGGTALGGGNLEESLKSGLLSGGLAYGGSLLTDAITKATPIDASNMTQAQLNDALETQLIDEMQSAGLSKDQINAFLDDMGIGQGVVTPANVSTPVTDAGGVTVTAPATPSISNVLNTIAATVPETVITADRPSTVKDVVNSIIGTTTNIPETVITADRPTTIKDVINSVVATTPTTPTIPETVITADKPTSIPDVIGATIPLITPTTPLTPTPVTPTTPTKPTETLTTSDIIKLIGAGTTLAAINSATSTPTTTPQYPIIPIPENWATPPKTGVAPYTPLTPINFGNRNLLIGTQWEKFLDPNYGKVPEPVQYSQPSNLSYNDLMGILGSKQGMPSPSSLSINDIISGIQNQYGQTPTSTVG